MATMEERILRLVDAGAALARIATGSDGAAVARLSGIVAQEIADLQRQREQKRRNGRKSARNRGFTVGKGRGSKLPGRRLA